MASIAVVLRPSGRRQEIAQDEAAKPPTELSGGRQAADHGVGILVEGA